MTAPAIEVQGLRKRFGAQEALCGIDLVTPAGSVLGLLGPNGAGKTTTTRILATLSAPDGGTARVAGFDVRRQSAQVRRAIGVTGQFTALDELLTGRENLRLVARLWGMTQSAAEQRSQEMLVRMGLDDAADRAVSTYSGGMRRRLDLAGCLIGRPAVLFLDEPTTGLDPSSRVVLWSMVRQEVGRGATVLLTTQYLEEAEQMADRIVVIDEGRVVATGTPHELKRTVGSERIDVCLTPESDLSLAVQVLATCADGTPVADPARRLVSVPVKAGIDHIARVAQLLQESGVEIEEFALRRPTLDDVFFKLTGRPGDSGLTLTEGTT
jgi:ABC-2 type transport system ATP-binding protein